MKQFTNLISSLVFLILLSCSNNDDSASKETPFTETKIDLTTHKINTYSIVNNTKYLVVFESGLGNDHTVWNEKKAAEQTAKFTDVLLYDRAGYGKSEPNTEPRNISKLSTELETVIAAFANGRKVILVGHSWGGMIIRDYAIKNPEKTAGLVFVDSSHELYNNPTQSEEDLIYNSSKISYGVNFGGTLEARQMIESIQYMTALPNLPNIPVVAITSIKINSQHDANDIQLWYNSKEALKKGVTDFTHITTTKSGHFIMVEEPNLVIENIQSLLSKLP
jgi:pimeloyl-ACP methyl ester carboxylesterase